MSNNKRLQSSRFGSAPFVTKEPLDLIIGGCGGVNMYTVFFLSRLQHNLYVYEMDSVEDINVDSQWFKYSDIGKNKIDCAEEMCKEYSNNPINKMGKFVEDSMVGDCCFSGFDNIAARKLMFEKWEKLGTKEIFLDIRCQAEEYQLYAVTNDPERIEAYKKVLEVDDSQIPDLMCTYKQTGHYAAMAATQAVALFCNFLANKKHLKELGVELREVPYFQHFNGSLWKNLNS